MVGVLCVLCMCKLGIENPDALLMFYKNWLDGPRYGCVPPKGNVAKYFNIEANLLDAHEEEIEEVGLLKKE